MLLTLFYTFIHTTTAIYSPVPTKTANTKTIARYHITFDKKTSLANTTIQKNKQPMYPQKKPTIRTPTQTNNKKELIDSNLQEIL